MVDGSEAVVRTGESLVVKTAPTGGKQGGESRTTSGGRGVVARKALLQDVGGGWKTVKGKRQRVTGIDWETWRRKRKVTAEALMNSSVAPYEGSGPMLYQNVFGFSGKRVHRKVLRDSWDQMTLEEIKDKTEREAEAFVKAAQLDAEYHVDYVATPPVVASSQNGHDSDKWKKDLFPHIQSMMDNEAKGLHFTGRMTTEYKDGKAVRMPTFTNETWRPNIVTGMPEQIPGAAHPSTVSIAEHELLQTYVRQGEQLPASAVFTRRHNSSDVRSEAAITGPTDASEADAAAQVLKVLQTQAAKGNISVAEVVDRLKKGQMKLSKHKRMLKHVKGFTLENLERMSNGTLIYNSAWGPARVIAGSKDARFGDTWDGAGLPGGPALPGRKRRDAAWFRERALKGNDKAQLSLGLCYAMGQGVPRHLPKAAAWFARAARQGNVQALTELAMCYRYGEGVEAANETSLRLLASAAARGGRDAQEELGISLLDGSFGHAPNATAAVRMLRSAAAQGSKRAATRLGLAHAEGRNGVPQDDDKAEYFLQLAASAYRKGHRSGAVGKRVREGARAMLKLGQRFRDGRGVKKDSTKAVDWFAKAAIKGLPKAHLCLGMSYLEGNGVPRDDVIGAQQVAIAAKSGCKEAAFNYALLLLQGRGLQPDAPAARRWFLTGALHDDPQCMVNYAVCMANGVGGDVDDGQARRWFLEAARHNTTSGQACFNLAILYEQGRGEHERSASDSTRALAYLRRSAAANYTKALKMLAERLLLQAKEEGLGAETSSAAVAAVEEEALALLRRAAHVGSQADVDSMLMLAAHLSHAGRPRGSRAEAEAEEEAAAWYLEAVSRGAPADCVDVKWLESLIRKGGRQAACATGGGNVVAKKLYIEVVHAAAEAGQVRGAATAVQVPGAKMIADGHVSSRAKKLRWQEGEAALVPRGTHVGAMSTVSAEETKRRRDVAMHLIQQLSEAGDPEYKFRYAQLVLSKTPGKEQGAELALDIMEEAAAGGHAEAMYFMGKAHAGGKHGLPPSDLAAVEWLARAAEAGHPQAQFTLGLFYQHGRGVSKDSFMATEWYAEAAEQGDAQAQFALGVAFAKGKGVGKSHEQACFWYGKAAAQDHGKAQFNLALRLTEGLGCVKDAHRAAFWFGRAALNGVFGRPAKIKKGVLQNAATRELVQPMTDAPSGARRQDSAQARRLMKLSEFNAIRWNRNPAKFRDGRESEQGKLARAEGKRLPRCLIVDDPEAPDYGKIYFTRPQVEAKEGAMARMLVVHGLDWDAMLLDHERNVFKWSKAELRRRARKVMHKRLAAPRELLFKHERKHLPRLRQLLQSWSQEEEERRSYLERAREAIADIDSRNGIEHVRGASATRLRQLQDARQHIMAVVGAADDRVDPARLLAREGKEVALDGRMRALHGGNLTLGLNLTLSQASGGSALPWPHSSAAALTAPGAAQGPASGDLVWRGDDGGVGAPWPSRALPTHDSIPSFLVGHLRQQSLKLEQDPDAPAARACAHASSAAAVA